MMFFTPGPWRASKVRDFFAIEAELPCINGLRAWFTVAIVHQSDEAEKGMSDGLKADAINDAEIIAAVPAMYEALRKIANGAPDAVEIARAVTRIGRGGQE
jgi:hypothetical protein